MTEDIGWCTEMTDKQPYTDHCGHERVCRFVILIEGRPCSGANCRALGHAEYDTRARGPVVAQPAPAAHYCTHLKWLTQIEGDGDYRCELGNKTSCEWCEGKSRCGDYQSVHDAALAQEREKWERERAEEHRTYESCHKHFACPDGEECWYSSADYYWDCGEGATRLSKVMAQAREDVLRILADAYQIEDTRPNVSAEYEEGACDALDRVISQVESLRRGQKQECEPE